MEKDPMDFGEMENSILMYDEEGNEILFTILATKEANGFVYILAAEGEDDDVEVQHFKCVATEEDEMIFELVDEEHEDFEKVFALFESDYEELGIDVQGLDE